MPRFLTENTEALKNELAAYLETYPGEELSAIQFWYEALGGYGVPFDEDYQAIEAAILATGEWEDAGDIRHEKFGVQKTFRSKTPYKQTDEKLRVQHLFRLNELYKDPAGKVFKIVLSEVYNLRTFEVVDGHLTGPMVKIDPTSDYAKSLVKVG
jgi:hypothetical protein